MNERIAKLNHSIEVKNIRSIHRSQNIKTCLYQQKERDGNFNVNLENKGFVLFRHVCISRRRKTGTLMLILEIKLFFIQTCLYQQKERDGNFNVNLEK